MEAIVVFDGVCNLCNGAAAFILKRDKNRIFQFSWLQSDAGRRLLELHSMAAAKENSLPFMQASIILICDEKIYTRSTAVLKILKLLGGGWKLFYPLILVPEFIRDGVYNFIAHNRYRWFGKKKACEQPEEKYRSRFLV